VAVPIVGLNASGSRLDGVIITSSTTTESHAPAVRVYAGTLDSVTIFSGQLVGGYDCVDANDVPVGAFVTRSAGGLVVVNKPMEQDSGSPLNAVVSGNSTHALLFGRSGERYSRLAVDVDGAMRYGDGASPTFHTTIGPVISNTTTWNPPSIEPGRAAVVSTRARARVCAVYWRGGARFNISGDVWYLQASYMWPRLITNPPRAPITLAHPSDNCGSCQLHHG
jgi:hypothetical protein